jgi:HPt (histidine-containing phosphotransfer) domain-containing protein
LGKSATTRTAIRLFEAAEGIAALTESLAHDVYKVHIPALSEPPGSQGTRLDGDLRAQLTATLAALTNLRGPDVERAFGPPKARAADAVACDEYGCAVELSFVPAEPPPAEVENLARRHTYSAEQMLVARATAFARPDAADVSTAYGRQPGGDPSSLNEQAVMLARRLFDACPEVDRVDVEIWQANCTPTSPTREDTKSLRAGVLRRAPEIARNVAFQGAVAESLGAESWSRRLREQATIAQSVVDLLRQLPDRLRRYDNAGRRRDWTNRVEHAAKAVASMPGRPLERRPVLGAARASALRQTAAEIDQELRAPDRPRDALEALTGALKQLSDHLDDRTAIGGAGSRFAQVPTRLREARALGAPAIGGVGDTLPEELDTLAALAGRLLTALEIPATRTLLAGPRRDLHMIDDALDEAAHAASQQDAQTVVDFLSEAGVPAVAGVIADADPIPAWRTYRAAVTVDVSSWGSATQKLQEWKSPARAEPGLTGRVVVVAVEHGEALPVGLAFFATTGDALPLLDEHVAVIASELGLPLRRSDTREGIQRSGAQLIAYSYEQVRRLTSRGHQLKPPLSCPPRRRRHVATTSLKHSNEPKEIRRSRKPSTTRRPQRPPCSSSVRT